MSDYSRLTLLSLLSAVLLSVPFLVPGTGFLSLIAFVPLLIAEEYASEAGIRGFWKWHYGCFVLWNAFTTFWVCNATVGGGIFAILANALQMSVIFALFRWSKKKTGGVLPYIFLAFAWVAWERFYLTWAEISWPWLVLGNAFARTTGWIQWYEYTGSLGGSLWVWTSNLAVFGVLMTLARGNWTNRTLAAKIFFSAGTLLLFVLPPVISRFIKPDEAEGMLDVVIVQPNIDPYDKFGGMTQEQQNDLLLSQLTAACPQGNVLCLAPETFTNDIITNDLYQSPTLNRFQAFADAHPGANILFGASSRTYLKSALKPSHTARRRQDGLWMETHNSSLMVSSGRAPDIFHKSKLVVAVEMTPYPAIFCPIDDLLGGVMGRNIGQDEVTNLTFAEYDSTGVRTGSFPVGSAICYESVYGEYCTEYVRKGAKLLTVITNDAWWKDTPGYRQHLSYSSLRAIETRRWIARCANTGVSAVIDPSGRILQRTAWWEPEVLKAQVGLSSEETFFVRNGDIAGRISVLMFLLLFFGIAVRSFTQSRSGR
ncbi:MAG: apolipoprotein N-acyltransferase [Candidatus Cryptobacteroides sp.]